MITKRRNTPGRWPLRVLFMPREQMELFPEAPEVCLPLRTTDSARAWLYSGLARVKPKRSGTCRQRPRSAGIGK